MIKVGLQMLTTKNRTDHKWTEKIRIEKRSDNLIFLSIILVYKWHGHLARSPFIHLINDFIVVGVHFANYGINESGNDSITISALDNLYHFSIVIPKVLLRNELWINSGNLRPMTCWLNNWWIKFTVWNANGLSVQITILMGRIITIS